MYPTRLSQTIRGTPREIGEAPRGGVRKRLEKTHVKLGEEDGRIPLHSPVSRTQNLRGKAPGGCYTSALLP